MSSVDEIFDWGSVAFGSRRSGKTTAMVEAAKKLDGILVCGTEQQAADLKREHGIKTASVSRPNRLRGLLDPVLFDPYSVAVLAGEYRARLGVLQEQLRKAGEEQRRLADEVAAAELELGAVWRVGGKTLAEGIRRKITVLEQVIADGNVERCGVCFQSIEGDRRIVDTEGGVCNECVGDGEHADAPAPGPHAEPIGDHDGAEPPDSCIFFGSADEELLSHETIEDYLEAHFDQLNEPILAAIKDAAPFEVCGWARQELALEECRVKADDLVERFLDGIDQSELGDPDGDHEVLPQAGRALLAMRIATALARTMKEHGSIWACKVVWRRQYDAEQLEAALRKLNPTWFEVT